MIQSLITFLGLGLMFANPALAREIVEQELRFPINIDQCSSAREFTGIPLVGCSISIGTELAESSEIKKKEFIGDSYFEVSVIINKDHISLLFQDPWNEELDPADFYKEIKEYFTKNKVEYMIRVWGPKLELGSSAGTPIPYQNDHHN